MRRHYRVVLPLALAGTVLLSAGAALLWPRSASYGRAYAVADLVAEVQASPRSWLGHRVAVRGRLVTLFNQNAPSGTTCSVIRAGPIHALATTGGTPLLLLTLAQPHSWFHPLLKEVPALAAALEPQPSWPSPAGSSWQELHGRLIPSPACATQDLHTAYLEVESATAAR